MLKNNPALERFKAKGLDVLILNEEVDTIVFPMLNEYKEYKLVNVTDAKFDESEEDVKAKEESQKEFDILAKEIKNALGEEIKEVQVTFDLTNSAVAIKEDKEDASYMMAQMMRQMGQGKDIPMPKPILQINPNHELIKKLKDSADANLINDAAHVLLDQAKLFNGMEIDDIPAFITKLNRIMTKAL